MKIEIAPILFPVESTGPSVALLRSRIFRDYSGCTLGAILGLGVTVLLLLLQGSRRQGRIKGDKLSYIRNNKSGGFLT